MSQLILPLIPTGATKINHLVNVYRVDNLRTYFVSLQPIFSHQADDMRMFRLITSQVIDSGACRQVDILKAFGVSKSSVARHILMLLSFMTLCRIKTVEQLRGKPPGEFDKLLGLDRIPEVRCLREKLTRPA